MHLLTPLATRRASVSFITIFRYGVHGVMFPLFRDGVCSAMFRDMVRAVRCFVTPFLFPVFRKFIFRGLCAVL